MSLGTNRHAANAAMREMALASHDSLSSLTWCQRDCPNYVAGVGMCADCLAANHEAAMDMRERFSEEFHWMPCGGELMRITRLVLLAGMVAE